MRRSAALLSLSLAEVIQDGNIENACPFLLTVIQMMMVSSLTFPWICQGFCLVACFVGGPWCIPEEYAVNEIVEAMPDEPSASYIMYV